MTRAPGGGKCELLRRGLCAQRREFPILLCSTPGNNSGGTKWGWNGCRGVGGAERKRIGDGLETGTLEKGGMNTEEGKFMQR